jgi:glycosyltransferase involved in cell wall biosynthesis
MNEPEISVVMSVYNGLKYLPGAIESILAQEQADFEFIIIDDGSTDGSTALSEQYASSDRRIRFIKQENMGLTRALIRGCQKAKGRFIARQDADDFSMPGRLAKLSDMLRNDSSLAFVSSWAEVIGPEDETLMVYKRPADPDAATHQVLYERIGPPGHGSVMFRREIYEQVGGYRSEFYYAQDSELWLRMARVGRLAYAQEVLYKYRISDLSLSGNRHSVKQPYADLIDELHEARMTGQSEEPILAKLPSLPRHPAGSHLSSQHQTLYFIGRCLFNRRDPRATKYLFRSVWSKPTNWKAWLVLAASLPLRLKSPNTGRSSRDSEIAP